MGSDLRQDMTRLPLAHLLWSALGLAVVIGGREYRSVVSTAGGHVGVSDDKLDHGNVVCVHWCV